MPKELRATTSHRASPFEGRGSHSQPSVPPLGHASHRNAAVWSDSDDQILTTARASGLNWQPIATRHFPSKTANACRKRHERLMERRNHDDWDGRKIDALAREYMECRKDMWSMLAARVGERWAVVEAKVCLPGHMISNITSNILTDLVHGERAQESSSHGTGCEQESGGD
ncbi:hypothetical protein BDV97DRAFT_118115 [Delphinella strobiligena]|nr:hypothetical protein BDV97DRAFT_118115 [Delphinella strobiligena]